jgi:hypothetical protein
MRSSALASAVVASGCGAIATDPPSTDPGKLDVPPDADAGNVEVPTPECESPRVRIVYLVPADREPVASYSGALHGAYAQIQAFFHAQVAMGKTFCFGEVEVIRTPHTASWYMATPSPRGTAYTLVDNGLADAIALTSGLSGEFDNLWAFYLDVNYTPGQAIGSHNGMVFLPNKDLRGLAGLGPDSRCSYVGASASFLAYTMGVRSPPDCNTGEPTCDPNALLRLGYQRFPETYLLEQQKLALAQNKFMLPLEPNQPVPDCAAP